MKSVVAPTATETVVAAAVHRDSDSVGLLSLAPFAVINRTEPSEFFNQNQTKKIMAEM